MQEREIAHMLAERLIHDRPERPTAPLHAQGIGIGPGLSNLSAATWIATCHPDTHREYRYMCRTAHPRFGAYRSKPGSGWEAMPMNGKAYQSARRPSLPHPPQRAAASWRGHARGVSPTPPLPAARR